MMVSVTEAESKLSELLKVVEEGQTVTICREGLPVAEIVPAKAAGQRNPKFGTLHGRIKVHDPDWWKPMSDQESKDFINGNY